MEHTSEMPHNVSINLYLRPCSIAIYGKFSLYCLYHLRLFWSVNCENLVCKLCITSILLKTVFCCTFWTQKILILWRKIVENLLCVFILSKKRCNWFHKNLHNSGMVGRRKLPDPSLNHIFNALSIGVQYTLSFQWTNFGLKCLI